MLGARLTPSTPLWQQSVPLGCPFRHSAARLPARRKKCLLVNNTVMLASACLLGFSKAAKSYEMILVGRFLCGVSAGERYGVLLAMGASPKGREADHLRYILQPRPPLLCLLEDLPGSQPAREGKEGGQCWQHSQSPRRPFLCLRDVCFRILEMRGLQTPARGGADAAHSEPHLFISSNSILFKFYMFQLLQRSLFGGSPPFRVLRKNLRLSAQCPLLPSVPGLCVPLHPQYLGEVSPKKLRGFANSTMSLFWSLGKALGQIMGQR